MIVDYAKKRFLQDFVVIPTGPLQDRGRRASAQDVINQTKFKFETDWSKFEKIFKKYMFKQLFWNIFTLDFNNSFPVA